MVVSKCATVDEQYLELSGRTSSFQARCKANEILNFNFEKIELYLPIRFAITIFIIIQIQFIAFYLEYHIRHHQHYFSYHHEVAFFFDKHLLVEGQNTSFNCSYFTFQKIIIWKRVLILFVLICVSL